MTDDFKRGFIMGMAMQLLAVTVPTYATLYDGLHGGWDFGGGITGLQKVVAVQQSYSGIDPITYTSASAQKIMRLSKSYMLSDVEDGHTDAIIIRTSDKIDLTPYSKMRILAVAFKNHISLTGNVYFKSGDVSGALSNQHYDFTDWAQICNCNITSADYSNPGTPT